MRIKSIAVENFLSFKKSSLDLLETGEEKPTIFVINGINYDNEDDDASNGSGKSAIIGEAVFYNIFGRGLRGSNKKLKLNDMIRYGTTKMFNSVSYFTKNNDIQQEMEIERVKSASGGSTMDIRVDGESKTKRLKSLSDNELRAYIDLSPDVFSQVVSYYKDNINLMSMNYSQRLDFFKTMVDMSIIDIYYDKFKDFRASNTKFLDMLGLKHKNAIEILDIINNNKEDYSNFLVKKLNDLKIQLDNHKKIEIEDSSGYKKTKKELEDKIDDLKKSMNEISSEMIILRSDKEKAEKEIQKFSSLNGGNCPTCKQLVSGEYTEMVVKEYNSIVTEKKVVLLAKQEEGEFIQNELKKIKKELNEVTEIIETLNYDEIEKEQKIRNTENEIRKAEIDIRNQEESKTDKDNLNKNKYEMILNCLTKAIKTRTDWKEYADYWYSMFAPKSLLRSSIIRKYILILSDIFEYYVSKLYNNEITGRAEIDDDGNIDILLFKNQYESNYWQLSSGERKRIDLAMMFSLYEFTSYLNPNIPKFMILDEIYDSLDYPGRLSVTTTLIDIQERHKIDLFIISHIPLPLENITDTSIIKNILVSKKDGCSEVKFLEETC